MAQLFDEQELIAGRDSQKRQSEGAFMIADSPLIGKIILILVLIAIDAFCSCAEIAVISLDASELEKMAEEKNKKQKDF